MDENKKNDLAITFANRSAVWVDKEEFSLAIRDAELAFDSKYPKDLHYKLYERKAQCQIALHEKQSASNTLIKAIESLEYSNLKADRRSAKLKVLQKMVTDVGQMKSNSDEPDQNCQKYGKNLLPTMKNAHKNFPQGR